VRGAIAAGHPLTAEAGARVLAEGGNAVDACIAAGLASWVAESPLTGPGGGGFMLVHRARDATTRVLDFFVAVPGLGRKGAKRREMEVISVDFSGESTQDFRIGAASCAVPGAAAGLEAAHDSFGSLPWKALFEPAIELARSGVELSRAQAYLHAILDLILRHTAEGAQLYGRNGEHLVEGDRFVVPDLAGTLELLAERGAQELYQGELGRALVRHVREQGGGITSVDLEAYRVVRRRPVRAEFSGHQFRSNPPPSTGGLLIGYALRLLDRTGLGGPPGSAAAIDRLVAVMREQARVRDRRFARELHRGGLALRLYGEEALERAWALMESREPALLEVAGPGGTTHVSVVDALGNAASLSVSTGSGSGVFVPGTGIQLNNMLGEFDLAVTGAEAPPGTRLTSGMAPSVVLRDGAPRLVVGSAGSLRLRGAILQAIVNVVGHELPADEALERPRVHLEGSQVHCEGGHDPAELDRLEAMGHDVVRWRRRNLYFGGTQAVEQRHDGSLAAAGDPRRGGHGIVVD
jgi:gamma-glutamyltranspeptidase/glutathione hydrolase